jgi:glycerol-3-phosphate cytidylyltransferase-like family protein
VSEVATHNIDLFTIGDDWERKFDFLKEHCYVVYLGRTQKISSTMILKLSRTIGGLGKVILPIKIQNSKNCAKPC